MAQTYGYFNSINEDRKYNADQMSEYFDGLVSNGVYESVGGALQVLASSGMNVQVKTGRAIIGNCKWFKNDATLGLAITQSHPTLNRYTAIVIRLNNGNRTIGIYAKDGTPASTAVIPAIQRDENIYELCLALIYVKAGATALTQADITDMRPSSSCGWVTGLVKQVDTSQLFLQWESAYEDFYRRFESWFDTLTRQLQVNTYINDYEKSYTIPADGTNIIPLDMEGYTYEEGDVISVYINGLYGEKEIDWFLDDTATPPTIRTSTSQQGTAVDIMVLKSKIGDPVSGGSSIRELTILNVISSMSTESAEGEVI